MDTQLTNRLESIGASPYCFNCGKKIHSHVRCKVCDKQFCCEACEVSHYRRRHFLRGVIREFPFWFVMFVAGCFMLFGLYGMFAMLTGR